jgi:hypothetical protein
VRIAKRKLLGQMLLNRKDALRPTDAIWLYHLAVGGNDRPTAGTHARMKERKKRPRGRFCHGPLCEAMISRFD